MMINIILVAIGGAIGAVCRYLLGLIPLKPQNGFPVMTFLINVGGAFLIGLFTALALKHIIVSNKTSLLLKTGICGGFTTFSSFMFEAVSLVEKGNTGVAIFYVVISCVAGVLAAFLGTIVIGR